MTLTLHSLYGRFDFEAEYQFYASETQIHQQQLGSTPHPQLASLPPEIKSLDEVLNLGAIELRLNTYLACHKQVLKLLLLYKVFNIFNNAQLFLGNSTIQSNMFNQLTRHLHCYCQPKTTTQVQKSGANQHNAAHSSVDFLMLQDTCPRSQQLFGARVIYNQHVNTHYVAK